MRAVPRPSRKTLAALALALALAGVAPAIRAQEPPPAETPAPGRPTVPPVSPGAPAIPPTRARPAAVPAPAPRRSRLRALFDRGARRPRANPDDAPLTLGLRRAQIPSARGDFDPGLMRTTFDPGLRRTRALQEGDQPARTAPEAPETRDEVELAQPRAEKEVAGGEPTEEVAEEEAAAPPAEPTLPTPFLTRILQMQDSPVKLYGWIQNSYTGNTLGRVPNGQNFGVNPNNLANQWQGNQYYLIVENVLEQNDTVNFGFRVDNLFGNDWQFNHMHGLFDTSFTPNHFAGYDPAQIYGEVHLPILTKGGLDVKGGRWYALAGYEVVPATGRPLLSVPYMFNYGQPFTHFGVLTTFHLSPQINLYNAAINGWDRWINQTYKWGYTGGFSWTSKNGKWGWTTILVWGPNQFPRYLPANTLLVSTGATPPPFLAGRRNLGYGANNRTLFTTVLTHKWNNRLTQVIETDQGFENNVPGLGPGGTNSNASWYSFGNWFLWDILPGPGYSHLTGVWRSEVFRDNNGIRTGFADNFYEMTLGAIVKPKSWLWIRPEARYDWAQFTHPYFDGKRNSQLTLAFDVIVLF